MYPDAPKTIIFIVVPVRHLQVTCPLSLYRSRSTHAAVKQADAPTANHTGGDLPHFLAFPDNQNNGSTNPFVYPQPKMRVMSIGIFINMVIGVSKSHACV